MKALSYLMNQEPIVIVVDNLSEKTTIYTEGKLYSIPGVDIKYAEEFINALVQEQQYGNINRLSNNSH